METDLGRGDRDGKTPTRAFSLETHAVLEGRSPPHPLKSMDICCFAHGPEAKCPRLDTGA